MCEGGGRRSCTYTRVLQCGCRATGVQEQGSQQRDAMAVASEAMAAAVEVVHVGRPTAPLASATCVVYRNLVSAIHFDGRTVTRIHSCNLQPYLLKCAVGAVPRWWVGDGRLRSAHASSHVTRRWAGWAGGPAKRPLTHLQRSQNGHVYPKRCTWSLGTRRLYEDGQTGRPIGTTPGGAYKP